MPRGKCSFSYRIKKKQKKKEEKEKEKEKKKKTKIICISSFILKRPDRGVLIHSVQPAVLIKKNALQAKL